MPSFRVAERWVSDWSLSEPVRFIALCWAIDSYARLTRQKFHATYRRLGAHLGFDWDNKPNGSQMVRALEILDEERERFLEKLRQYRKTRRGQKRMGRRQPDRIALVSLYVPDFLVVPHPPPIHG